MKDALIIGGHQFNSRFILGSGKFSLEMTRAVIENGGVEMATLALRRAQRRRPGKYSRLYSKRYYTLPNTSGARNAKEAVRICAPVKRTRLR